MAIVADKNLRTYEIVTNDGTYRIEIPEDWKVTFGPVAVGGGNKRGFGDSSGSMALRLYESEVRQRAIFTGVSSFRDLSIPITKLVRTVKEKSARSAQHGPKGSKSSAESEVEYDERWEDA
jgi:hypothetical protein